MTRLLMVALMAIVLAGCGPAVVPAGPAVGQTAHLHVDGQDVVFVATSRGALDQLRKFLGAGDTTGARQMVVAGDALIVANDTRALVLARGAVADLRLLEGPYNEREVWTEPDWVVR